jgi:uncharacterized protein
VLSIDTNLLFYAQVEDCPEHTAARHFVLEAGRREDALISEFVLVELYRLLRNPVVVKRPLPAPDAVAVIEAYRQHPRWRLAGFTSDSRSLHDALWKRAAAPAFGYRRIFDARLALTLRHHGVSEWATTNVRDFEGFGFTRVWNPLAG